MPHTLQVAYFPNFISSPLDVLDLQHRDLERRRREDEAALLREDLVHSRHFVVKTITTAGTFRFGKRIVYLANTLTNQRSGMKETDDGLWSIYFHTVLLAAFDERDYIIQS